MSTFSRASGWVRPTSHTHDAKPPQIGDDVVAGARAGNRGHMDALLRAYNPFAAKMLYSLAGPVSDLEDLHQMVLIKIATGLSSFKGDSAITTWIASICVRVVHDHFRKRRAREKELDNSEEVLAELPAGLTGSMEATIEAREELALMRKAIATLSRVQRTAFVLKTLGHSIEEIAAITKSAQSTTRLRLYYGRKKLAKVLEALRKPEGES
jgi:RNA polymerase sigma-70 factor, ECF subfamily